MFFLHVQKWEIVKGNGFHLPESFFPEYLTVYLYLECLCFFLFLQLQVDFQIGVHKIKCHAICIQMILEVLDILRDPQTPVLGPR